MGYTDVFLHVGDQVKVKAPNGRWVTPIVTGRVLLLSFIIPKQISCLVGTFGSNDFFHSLLGGMVYSRYWMCNKQLTFFFI